MPPKLQFTYFIVTAAVFLLFLLKENCTKSNIKQFFQKKLHESCCLFLNNECSLCCMSLDVDTFSSLSANICSFLQRRYKLLFFTKLHCSFVKCLGLILDKGLTWKAQQLSAINKAYRVFWTCKSTFGKTGGLKSRVVHWI